jgi:tripartite-type tricarboxylate transporter receptor subunit TctC
MLNTLKYAAALGLSLGLWASPAIAQAQSNVESFYKSKDVTIVIGYGVGGGYDSYARLLGRHMAKHLPGAPDVVPQNMPGGGALKAANYLFSIAPKDGSVIGTFAQQLALAPLLGTASYDARKFTWIGSITNEPKICVFSTSSPVASWEDMLQKEHRLGGEAPGADIDVVSNAIHTLFETKSKIVTGYHGSNELMLAVERGEIHGTCGQSYGSFMSRYGDLVRQGKVKIVVYASQANVPELKDVPNVFDLAKTDEQKGVLNFVLGASIMGRPYAAPPGIPQERKEALRKAFDETMKDPAFLEEAKKLNLEVSPSGGAAIEEALAKIYETPKAVVEKAAKVSGMK